MVDLLAGSSMAIALVCFVSPRFFRLVDVLEMQRRLHAADLMTQDAKPSLALPRHLPTVISPMLDFATLCESLARATRSGASPHDALLVSLQRHQFHHLCWSALFDDVAALQSCDSSLATARESVEPRSNDAQCLSLLESAMVHGNFVPSALDHASSVLRDRAACSAELAVAASQAQLSARLLSMLPFVLLGGAILVSSQFRSSLWSPLVLFPLFLGFMLNRIGWRWISSLISRAVHDEPDDIGQLTEHLCVSLRTGLSMTHACERWRAVSPTGNAVADLISAGAPLEEALLPLATTHPISGKNLGHTIVEAERDGLPILDTVMRLATDHRIERRRQIDTHIRQLPTRLSIPLVLCVLPSFLLLSVAPLVLASLSQLSVSLPSVTQ
ncbi:MAG: type II secretion system F family protein [Actinobacteria bacterium]|nr:type II secretion system F family protein [Actinomycetota bacterium]